MLVKQISIFVPNEKGRLAALTKLLMEKGIDIRAISLFDTTEFGILRMVVDDPEGTVGMLKQEGIVAKISPVLAVKPVDKPGSLNEIFEILSSGGFNIDYIYSYVMRQAEPPYIVLKTNDMEKAVRLLQDNGIDTVS